MDFSKFKEAFRKITEKTIPKEAGKGLFKAGNELLSDAIKKSPKAPFDEGHLRASARVDKAEVKRREISVDAGFNIEYAARWHEIPKGAEKNINWSLPGSGRKYLETKMYQFKDKYMYIAALHVKRSAK